MTVTLERDALLGVVRKVASAVEARNTIPILSNVLFEASGGMVRVTGTDLDLQVRAECEAVGDLRTTIDARRLQDALSSLKPGQIELTPVDDRAAITLKQGRSVRTLPTLPANDFPEYKLPDAAAKFALPAGEFGHLIESVQAAVSSEEARIYLNGIFIHAIDGKLRLAATDGHRLLRNEADCPEGAEGMPDIIVPRKTVGLLRKLFDGFDGEIAIEASTSKIVIEGGPVRILSKLIDGTFPDYVRVIPSDRKNKLIVAKGAVVEAAQAVAAVAADKVRAIKITLAKGADPELSVKDSIGSSAIEPLDGDYTGASVILGVNGQYLIGVANSFRDTSKLEFQFDGPSDPVRITAEAEPGLIAVIMPLRV